VSGTVTSSEDGFTMPGVSVVVIGTTIGTATDFDGNYTLTTELGQELQFTFMGYTPQVHAVAGTTLDIVMQPDARALDEVVVVGYGVQSKKNVISSVTKVKAENLQEVAVAGIDAALQGNAVGLSVSQNSGAPGGGMSVRVRGATTIAGSNQPLYIIDGVPVISGNTSSDTYGGQGGNALTNISTNDIESVEVLKDASATAIYGSRGSNGVILITTKSGKTGKPRVSLGTYYGVQNSINRYDPMYQGEYYKFADLAFANADIGLGSSFWSNNNGYVDDPNLTIDDEELASFYESRDGDRYIDFIYRDNAPIWETNVSVSGGNETTQYYFGGSVFQQDGVILGQDYDRKTIRLNLDHKVNDWAKLTAGVSISDENVNRITGDNNIYSPMTTAILEAPGYDLKNEDGSYNNTDFRFSNPLQNAEIVDGESNSMRTLANAALNMELLEGLYFDTRWGLDLLNYRERRYFPSDTYQGRSANGDGFVNSNSYQRWISTNTLNYAIDFDNLNITALAGMEYQQFTTYETSAQRQGYASPKLRWPSEGAEVIDATAETTQNRLLSYLSRLTFSYDDRFLFELGFRADASSKFGEDSRWGYFPSVSAGWKLHNEELFEVDWISEIKPRAGWGQTGNSSGIGNFASRGLAGSANYGNDAGTAVTNLGNESLTWETTSQFNAGIDMAFVNDRFRFSYDYFNKQTTDLLLDRPLPKSSGWESIESNVGEMLNTGHEFSVGIDVFSGEFSWVMDFNIATLHNEVTKLYEDANGESTPIDYGFAGRVQEGASLGAFFVFKTNGLDENGDVIYVNSEGENVYNGGTLQTEDKIIAGKPLPDFTGNFRNTLSFLGLDLSVNFQFSQGFELYNNTMAFAGASGSFAFNKMRSELDYWTSENTDTDTPRPLYGAGQSWNNQDSDRFIEDGSYIRLKSVILGYNFPKDMIEGMNLRIYVGGDNLMTWTDYSGLDPEVNAFGATNVSMGTDFFTQGLNRTWKVGLNVSF
ncbi:MAG: TonB-dependent receptor, partial [Bacteroidota bacterium]